MSSPSLRRWMLSAAILILALGRAWAAPQEQRPSEAAVPASLDLPAAPATNSVLPDLVSAPLASADEIAPAAAAGDELLAFFPTQPAGESSKTEAVRRMLARIDPLRLWIADAPGHGHQAAAGMIVRRLSELGYGGTIEVVAERRAQARARLMLPSALSERIISPAAAARSKVELALVAARDVTLAPSRAGARVVVTVQPLLFGLATIQEKGHYRFLKVPEKRGFVFSPSAPSDPAAFALREMRESPDGAGKAGTIAALLRRAREIDLLPAYGLDAKRNPDGLLKLLLGVRHAQTRGDPRGAVVALFSDPGTEAWNSLARGADADLAWRVLSVDAAAPEAAEAVRSVGPGRILVLKVGAVKQSVFELLYSRATLPALAQGVNSQNLMAVLGRPYLAAGDSDGWWERELFGLLQKSAPRAARLRAAAQRALRSGENASDAGEQIGRFIREGADPFSPLSRAFRQARLADPEEDRLVEVLYAALKAGTLSYDPKTLYKKIMDFAREAARRSRP